MLASSNLNFYCLILTFQHKIFPWRVSPHVHTHAYERYFPHFDKAWLDFTASRVCAIKVLWWLLYDLIYGDHHLNVYLYTNTHFHYFKTSQTRQLFFQVNETWFKNTLKGLPRIYKIQNEIKLGCVRSDNNNIHKMLCKQLCLDLSIRFCNLYSVSNRLNYSLHPELVYDYKKLTAMHDQLKVSWLKCGVPIANILWAGTKPILHFRND